VQRDAQDLTRISALGSIPRLLQLAATQTARLANVAEMASAFQLSRPTISDYVVLLERIFSLEHLPPWHSNRLSRLIKTPKLHMSDTGLASAFLGVGAEFFTR
jgi:predicted AAA+ superfamily ATPase